MKAHFFRFFLQKSKKDYTIDQKNGIIEALHGKGSLTAAYVPRQHTDMQHIFILNPAAGHSDSTVSMTEQIRQTYGEEAIVYETRGVGDATAFVKEYA